MSLIVTLTIIALCAGIAGYFYEQNLNDSRRTRARLSMKRIRDAYMLWQVRKAGREPESISDLASFLEAGDRRDPWGHEFILDLDKRRVICLGPDGKPDPVPSAPGTEQQEGDDFFEELPPPDIPLGTEPRGSDEDRLPPVITDVRPQGPVTVRRPQLTALFTDSGSGVDAEMSILVLDGEDVSLQAVKKKDSLRWTPPSDLSTGLHEVTVKVQDYAGNVAMRPWSFTIMP